MIIENSIVCITGGLGNVGSYVVEDCLDYLGASKIVIVDNFYNSSINNMNRFYPALRKIIELEEIDVSDDKTFSMIMRKHKPDYVFHLASTLTLDTKRNPKESVRTNINGTQNVIESCLENDVEHLVVASSASVFGDPDEVPTNENHHYKNNKLLYGACKIANEVMLTSYAEENKDFHFTANRFFNVYGPRATVNNVYTQIVQKWIKMIKVGEPIVIYGDGTQTMDMIHAKDASNSMILAVLKNAWRGNVVNERKLEGFFNIGSGISTSVNELKDILFEILEKKVEVTYEVHDPNLVKERCCDNSLAKAILDWHPTIDVKEGLKESVKI